MPSEHDPNRIRIGGPSRTSATDSHERTNERTNGEVGTGCKSGNGSRRERTYEDSTSTEPVSLSVAARGWLDRFEAVTLGKRWEVTRSGERDPIPPHVRAAIWYRDGGKCAECLPEWPRSDVMHLDHIKPWSAGGADTTDNLRLLCDYHNVERSNYVDFAEPVRPATWWCANCYTLDRHIWRYDYPYITCPRHGSDPRLKNARCRVARAYAKAWINEQERPTWHERPMLTVFDLIAYCAHCDAPGLTGVVL